MTRPRPQAFFGAQHPFPGTEWLSLEHEALRCPPVLPIDFYGSRRQAGKLWSGHPKCHSFQDGLQEAGYTTLHMAPTQHRRPWAIDLLLALQKRLVSKGNTGAPLFTLLLSNLKWLLPSILTFVLKTDLPPKNIPSPLPLLLSIFLLSSCG